MKKILTLRAYFESRFGTVLQRIPLDPGFPCPNRKPDGSGGCAFCPADGSRARHLKPGMTLREQVFTGIEFAQKRYGAKPPYAAYFQAYTTTNTDAATLRKLYRETLALADFRCVIIATRPDCLPPEVVDVIAELTAQYEVWVELGVQTSCDSTLEKINRGHSFAAVRDAVTRLTARGIRVAAHVILGLPGETLQNYLQTAADLAALPFSGVKIHNLLIYRNTAMETLYRKGEVRILNEYDYANALAAFLRALPENWVVMRMCADAPDSGLAGGKWWMDKGAFTEMFLKMFENGTDSPDCMTAVRTGDGSYTFYHPEYRQHFHSVAGAWDESLKKYLEPCRIRERLEQGENISILDVGFGMGCNVCAAVEMAESVKKGKLFLTTLELDRAVPEVALRLPERKGTNIVRALVETGRYVSDFAEVNLILGDARKTVPMLDSAFHAVFLDAFSPDCNPELWTLDFIAELKKKMTCDGVLASYCSAYPFRGALIENGFCMQESIPFGRRRGGTVASLKPLPELPPLPEKEYKITTLSTAGTPYRDPGLQTARQTILQERHERVQQLRASGMPKWYRP